MPERSAFAGYWTASAISDFGSAVTLVAIPVLVVTTLHATPTEVGIVSAAQVLPYAAVGLLAGVVVDRVRRKPLLIGSSLGRAACLGAIPVLFAAGLLGLWALAAVLFLFGTLSVFGFAAAQSFLPRVVPRERLVSANARLDQADAAAQTAGPAIGGALVGVLGAPVALLVDAVSYLVEAVLLSRLRVEDPMPERAPAGRVRADIAEGLRWTYHHRTLAPMAVSTHVWFVANGAAAPVLAVFALRTLGLPPLTFGLVLAAGGIAMLAGASAATRLGARLGLGRTLVLCLAVEPVAWVLVASAPEHRPVRLVAVALLTAGFVLHAGGMGVENANSLGYRQAVTPDALLGRTNATMRSANRTAAAVGAVAGGVLATAAGPRVALLAITAVFAAAFAVAVLSPLRTAVFDPAG